MISYRSIPIEPVKEGLLSGQQFLILFFRIVDALHNSFYIKREQTQNIHINRSFIHFMPLEYGESPFWVWKKKVRAKTIKTFFWKVSKYVVSSGPYFPVFGLYT